MSGRVTPFLWFDGQAEAAMNFYVSIFDDAKILDVSPVASTFELFGQRFVALNGNDEHRFTPAVSFMVECATQAEIDRYWEALADGGTPMVGGWISDKYGVTWQIVPSLLTELLGDDDDEKGSATMRALCSMQKIDIAALQAAHDAGPVSVR